MFYRTYDDCGNISTISENNVEKLRYAYNELNQLIREDNAYAGKSYTYKYDIGGNITEKKEYAYTTGTLGAAIKTTPYLYGDSNWKDKLTAYDGKEITYDELGNPLTFDGNTFSWTGRQLDSISGNGKEISYKYNADGIRTEKTVNGKTTKYYLEGSRIVLEKDENEERTFWYDGDGKPAAFNVYSAATSGNSESYYYIYNGQGDVIGLFDRTGAVVCHYYYDAWGKLLKITDGNGVDKTSDTNFIGYKNPIRYRGYYYDNETGLYYLSSRYYSPEIGRFINADDSNLVTSSPMALIDKNLYAYCDNNPVTRKDDGGNFWDTVFDVVSLVSSIVEVCNNPTDPWAWAGVVGDAVDLIPFVTGVGEATRAVKAVDKVVDVTTDVTKDVTKVADEVTKVVKTSSERRKAVRQAWKNEYNDVMNDGTGISRIWTPDEIKELKAKGKVKGYQGHHMKSVKGYPELAGDSSNIQFLTRKEHLAAHGGNFRNITDGRYQPYVLCGIRLF